VGGPKFGGGRVWPFLAPGTGHEPSVTALNLTRKLLAGEVRALAR